MQGILSIGNSDISYEDMSKPDIIDVEGREIESTPIKGDNVDMDKVGNEKMKNEGGWIKAPGSSNNVEPIKSSKKKVENEEDLDKEESKLFSNSLKVTIAAAGVTGIIAIILMAYNKDKIINLGKNFKADLTKTNNEQELEEEPNYDKALASNGAVIEENNAVEENEEAQQLEKGAYDEVIGGQVLAFTDPYDDEQVYARAEAIYTYLQKSNVMDVTIDELCDQIKFVNGTYNASTDDEAWDVYNSCLDTFDAYTNNIIQNVKFASNMVDENGVHAALGFGAFLVDNSPHSALMEEADTLFVNLLTAQTMEEKTDAAKMFIKFESDLMIGLKETPNGTKISYIDLNDSEAFIIGLMFQTGNMTCTAALGDNIEITYTDNIGVEHIVPLQKLREYYYASTCGEQTVWEMASYNLIETAISKSRILTPSN